MGTQKKSAVIVKKIEVQKRVISLLFIIMLIAQIFIFYAITNTGQTLNENSHSLKSIEDGFKETFVSDTIRNQLRIMLTSTRQSWVQYLSVHPELELLKKINDKYLFTNEQGDSILFNPKTMEKKKINEHYYDIYNSESKEIIMNGARPTWNKKAIEEILSVIAIPLKAYGPNGSPIIYDAYTGQIIVGNGTNIKTLYQENCLNVEAYNEFTANSLMIRRDTDKTSNLINLCLEPNIPDQIAANDFNQYPLGDYNRIFVEKIILPYEAVSVDGQDMQIAIILSASEKEIIDGYQSLITRHMDSKTSTENASAQFILYPIISVGISLVVILFAIFTIRLLSYQCKKCSIADKEKTM